MVSSILYRGFLDEITIFVLQGVLPLRGKFQLILISLRSLAWTDPSQIVGVFRVLPNEGYILHLVQKLLTPKFHQVVLTPSLLGYEMAKGVKTSLEVT